MNFNIENMNEFRDKAKRMLKEPIPEQYIKQREGGKDAKGNVVWLDYVEGSTVIRKLNAAFDNMWDWDPFHFEIIKSQPKKVTKRWNNNTRRMEVLAEPEYEEQAPVAHVVGRLTVPGFGSRVGFGSKTVIGGASEQESCFKSANTDALKVAAKLFGIALELYEDEPVDFELHDDEPVATTQVQQDVMPARGGVSIPASQPSKPVQEQTSQEDFNMNEFTKIQQLSKAIGLTSSAPLADYISEMTGGLQTAWSELTPNQLPQLREYLEDIHNKLQEQMSRLGLDDISGLNSYIREFSEGEIPTFENLKPTHLKTFIIYLERQ